MLSHCPVPLFLLSRGGRVLQRMCYLKMVYLHVRRCMHVCVSARMFKCVNSCVHISVLLLLIRQIKTPVSSMKVAVHYSSRLSGAWSGQILFLRSSQGGGGRRGGGGGGEGERSGLQQMFCCLTVRTARALLCMADAEFRIQYQCSCVSVSMPAQTLVYLRACICLSVCECVQVSTCHWRIH